MTRADPEKDSSLLFPLTKGNFLAMPSRDCRKENVHGRTTCWGGYLDFLRCIIEVILYKKKEILPHFMQEKRGSKERRKHLEDTFSGSLTDWYRLLSRKKKTREKKREEKQKELKITAFRSRSWRLGGWEWQRPRHGKKSTGNQCNEDLPSSLGTAIKGHGIEKWGEGFIPPPLDWEHLFHPGRAQRKGILINSRK